jgi:hypothetical protein
VAVGGVSYAPGKVGQAFSFNGVDGYVDLGHNPSLDIPGSITVEAWVNYQDLTHYKYLVADFDASGTVSQGSLGINNDHFFWYQSTTDGGSIQPIGATTLAPGQWYHVAVVRDDIAKTVKLYVNGAVDGSASYAGTVVGLQQTKVLGTSEPREFPNDFFHGLIDEPSIFNRALSAAEVQSIFAAGSAGKAGLVGVYVNLQTGTATQLAGGIANIQNVTGSQFNDILVGNGGNVLIGGAGRNLLIAGGAGSTLIGGNGEDILVGGTTAYDQNATALAAILAEWTDPNLDYATRVANLIAGTGVPALNATTAHSNGGANTLTGGGGLDLFLGNLANDTTDWDPQTETFLSI